MLILSDFNHYSLHLLLDIYPLSIAEYAGASLERRASYSYVNEIIEGAQDLARSLLGRLRQRVPTTWKGRIQRAEEIGLFPPALASALLDLRQLRNSVVHENRDANAELIVYPELGTVIVVGFALFEVWRVAMASTRPTEEVLVVDKEYLVRHVVDSANERAAQALSRLSQSGASIPRITIVTAGIRDLLAKAAT